MPSGQKNIFIEHIVLVLLCSYKYVFQELKFYVTLKHTHVFFFFPS